MEAPLSMLPPLLVLFSLKPSLIPTSSVLSSAGMSIVVVGIVVLVAIMVMMVSVLYILHEYRLR